MPTASWATDRLVGHSSSGSTGSRLLKIACRLFFVAKLCNFSASEVCRTVSSAWARFSTCHFNGIWGLCGPTDKGQIISKLLLVSSDSSKKRTNEFVFFCLTVLKTNFFLEESEDTKKSFRNYLTFRIWKISMTFIKNALPNQWNRNSDLEKEQMKPNQVYTDILYVEYKYKVLVVLHTHTHCFWNVATSDVSNWAGFSPCMLWKHMHRMLAR